MNRLRTQIAGSIVALAALLAAFPAAAQCNDGREGVLSDTFVGSNAVEWRMLVEHKAVTLTISAPCGLVVDRTYKEGESPFFSLKEIPADNPDGTYHWSLRISPHVDPSVEKELAAAHASGNDGRDLEYQLRQKGLLPAGPFTQSGTLTVFRGSIVPPDLKEEGATGKLSAGVRPAASAGDCPVTAAPAVQTARLGAILPAVDRGGSTREMAAAAETPRRITAEDFVINDDLIVIGSACIGFDCVNGEVFSFDTIRLKENNLRIKFDDTSTSTGFPSRDWQLTANDSASGGANKFSIDDVTGGLVPFTVTAGAPSNSLFVASTGRVGIRTSSPILDLHIANSNTPGIRLEQTSAGGFTAQTWDIAGNEANFFVRDVTGGSRLPLRIRPGAPTSSIDVNNAGNVGIGTASPQVRLDVQTNVAAQVVGRIQNKSATGFSGIEFLDHADAVKFFFGAINSDGSARLNSLGGGHMEFRTSNVERLRIAGNGNIGIGGVTTPSHPIEHTSGAHLTSGGAWINGSSRETKQDVSPLSAGEAMAAFADLEPVKFRYSTEVDEQYIGFIAEDVPELVATADRKGLSPMDVVAVMTKIVQEQQKVITRMEGELGSKNDRLDQLQAEFELLKAAVADLQTH
jgi:hypothetical protein